VQVDLAKARKSFVMDSELYSCFVCVPVHSDFTMKPDHWRHLLQIIKSIQSRRRPNLQNNKKYIIYNSNDNALEGTQDDVEDPADYKAAKNIGIFKQHYYQYVVKEAQNQNRNCSVPTTEQEIKIERILRNFYVACMLQQLVSERSKEDVANEFHIYSASFVETLQEMTGLFAKKCYEFCRNVQWFQLAAVLDEFGTRIKHGAKREILALAIIEGVKPPTARLLFQDGLRNVEEVARAGKIKIMKALAKGNSYQKLDPKDAKARIREKADTIWKAAHHILRGEGKVGIAGDDDLLASASLGDGGDSSGGGVAGAGGSGRGGGKRKAVVKALPAPAKKRRQEEEQKQVENEKETKQAEVRSESHEEEWEAMKAVHCPVPDAQAQPLPLPAPATDAPPAANRNAGGGANNGLNAGDGRSNEQNQHQQEQELPPPPYAPGNNADGNGDDNDNDNGNGKGHSQRPAAKKPPPTGLFLINTPERLDRIIRVLSTLSIFAAQFITVPHKRAISSPIAQIKEIAAMAPPLKIKKKEGQQDKRAMKAAAMYDDDLDAGDVKAQKNAGPKPGTVLGIAISWGPGAAAYIPLSGTAAEGLAAGSVTTNKKNYYNIAAQKIADVILASDVEVVWFGWKNQMESTRWLLSQASATAFPAAAADANDAGTSGAARFFNTEEKSEQKVLKRTGADLSHFMTDARIAMWMCQPDSSMVQDGILTDDDVNSKLLGSDGKRKKENGEKKIFAPEALLRHFFKGDTTAVNRALHGLTKDDKKRPMGTQALFACQTAAVALELRNVAFEFLASQNDPAMFVALRRYEMPLVPVLADMERAGVGFSIEKLNKMMPRMKRRLAELHTLAHEAAGPGDDFNMDSPADIQSVLFRRLKLPPPHGCEKETISRKDGSTFVTYSTASKFLAMLADVHPIIPMIQEHRKLIHTVGRVRDMIELAKAERALLLNNGEKKSKTAGGGGGVKEMHGVAVHCPFIHTGTASGRLAMEGFNLQNLTNTYAFKVLPSQPKDGGEAAGKGGGSGGSKTAGAAVNNTNDNAESSEYTTNLTQEKGHIHLEANLRSAIVPSKPGRVILGADFRQIEFRLMAHFSKDPVVRAMLADGAEDPFKLVAARWRKLPVEKVTKKIRDDAKQVVYALFYGMGAGAMADKLEVSPKVAQQMKDEFLNTYSGIRDWIEQVKLECADRCYITTLAGRRRWIPEIKSDDFKLKSSGERKAVNTICQGSAADVAKKAMIDICREFEVQNLRDHVDMVLQIHDELVFEVDVEYQHKVARIVKECMENAAVLDIPLRAKLEAGVSWGEMTRLEL
jgi:DNA polymerase I-like protein with 3'-5' exonuclease and polymerase domains